MNLGRGRPYDLGKSRESPLNPPNKSIGDPGGSRTPNPQIRSLMLYPVELRGRDGGWRNGVGNGNRTRNRRSHSPVLYRLSYSHRKLLIIATAVGAVRRSPSRVVAQFEFPRGLCGFREIRRSEPLDLPESNSLNRRARREEAA
jgi:hypothetical protein